MKNTKKRKFVVWTSEFEKKGLPISVEIRMRRKAMNVTKETDPIKDFLVITDKSIIAEEDTAKRMRLAKRYLKEKGLDDVISIANVLFYTMEEPLPISGILTDVSMRGNFVNEIDPSDIIFGGIEGEFKYGADMEDIKVINLSSDAAYNLGMYRMMIEMLVSGTTDVPGFSQLMEGIEGKPNWYIYNLPKVIPENYKALYDEYRSYIENILSKA